MLKRSLVLILVVYLGLTMVFSLSRGFSFPLKEEINVLSATIKIEKVHQVANAYKREIEAFLYLYYLNDRAIRGLWGEYPEGVRTVKQAIGDRRCFYVVVLPYGDFRFHPQDMWFVQGGSQYGISREDVLKITSNFSTQLASLDTIELLIFIPKEIEVYSPFEIRYGDAYATFSVSRGEEEEKEVTMEERIQSWKSDIVKLKTGEEFKGTITDVNELCVSLKTDPETAIILGWESINKVYTSIKWARNKILEYAPNKLGRLDQE